MPETQPEHPIRISRSNNDVKVNVQRQLPRHGGPEYSASYQRLGEYEDGTEYEGISLSLFIKDEATTRLLYECLRELFEERELDKLSEKENNREQ